MVRVYRRDDPVGSGTFDTGLATSIRLLQIEVHGRRLAFSVVEQRLHFERDVTLLDGSFSLSAVTAGSSRMILQTRYRRHLRPAWLWGPIERFVCRTVHAHILEGIRREAGKGLEARPRIAHSDEVKEGTP